jgi:hypothetical protein
MKTMAALVTVLALLSLPAAARARPVTCRSGATMAAFPGLRIIGVAFRHRGPERDFGYEEYACTGPHARPLHVGLSSGAGGTYEEDTLRYDLAGRRYLAAGRLEEDEGGGELTVSVWDLRTRRQLIDEAVIDGVEGDPLIRLAAGGVAIDPGEGDPLLVAPGHKPRLLSNGGDTDVAVAGSTLYWTESGVAHSLALPGASGDAPDSFVDLPTGGLFPGRCRARIGNDVARDGWLRVAHGASGWFACTMRSRRALSLPAGVEPDSVRIAAQRWVYFTAGGSGHVVDMKARAEAGTVTLTPGAQPLLLDDGRVAWIDSTGTLFAQRPGAAPVALATGASALAAAGTVLYWTSGGVPQRG